MLPRCVLHPEWCPLHVAHCMLHAGAKKAYLVATTVAAIPAEAAATGLERVVLHLPGTHIVYMCVSIYLQRCMQQTPCNGQPATNRQHVSCIPVSLPAEAAKNAGNRV